MIVMMIIKLKLIIMKTITASLNHTMKRIEVNSQRGSNGGEEVEENTISYTKTDRNDN